MKFQVSNFVAASLLRTTAAIAILAVVVVGIMYLVWHNFIQPPVESFVEPEKRRTASEITIQLSIRNSTKIDNLGKQLTSYMRMRGFDVVEIGNYPTQVEQSFVIDYVGDTLSARRTAYACGIQDSLISVEIDSTLYLRCGVVIGQDYKSLKAFD